MSTNGGWGLGRTHPPHRDSVWPSRAVFSGYQGSVNKRKRAGGSGPLDISYEPLAHLQCTGLLSSLLVAQPRGEVELVCDRYAADLPRGKYERRRVSMSLPRKALAPKLPLLRAARYCGVNLVTRAEATWAGRSDAEIERRERKASALASSNVSG